MTPLVLKNIKFPNRNSKFLRDSFIFSQLDGEGTRQMQLQQEKASKQAFKESLLKQIAINTGSNLSDPICPFPSAREEHARGSNSNNTNTNTNNNNNSSNNNNNDNNSSNNRSSINNTNNNNNNNNHTPFVPLRMPFGSVTANTPLGTSSRVLFVLPLLFVLCVCLSVSCVFCIFSLFVFISFYMLGNLVEGAGRDPDVVLGDEAYLSHISYYIYIYI